MYIFALIVIAAVLAVVLAFARNFLLGWYIHEVQGLDLPEEPGEAIITYPLA